jgi:hypothetical protein
MSWVPAEQVLSTVASQRQVLASEQARIANFAQYHTTERQKLEAEYKQAAHDLGSALLPSLDARAIAAAADAVGLVGLPAENVPAKLEARRSWLASRIAELGHDPRFTQRELLRHPHTGSLTRALAEAQEYRQPSSGVISACETHMRFDRLWASGFGTPEFSAPWWRYSYWEDRSAAAELVAVFQGKTTFAEVREEYRAAKENVATYDAEIARLHAELAAGEAVSREHAEHVDEHQHLDARGLEHTRGRIIQHLLGSDASLVSQRLQRWPALRLLFLRASGVAAKISYLDNIQRTNLAEMQKEYAAQQQRLNDVEMKTRRRWAPMALDRYQKIAEDRRPRYEKRWQRFGKVYGSVYSYNRWDRGRYYEDLLWWDLMTRGRYDGSYIPEVSYFHQHHPHYHYDPDYKALADAQRADSQSVETSDFGGSADTSDASDFSDAADVAADAEAAASAIDADTGGSDDSPDISTTDAS